MFRVSVLLVLSSQPINALTTLTDGRQSREVHGSPPTYIEWAILVYVVGSYHSAGNARSGVLLVCSCAQTVQL